MKVTPTLAPKQGATASIVDLTGKNPQELYVTIRSIPSGVLVRIPIDTIRPASVNDKIYRPVNTGDPAIKALADDIRRNGLVEPIVITRDRYILSGHRRHAACRLLGLESVTCRLEDVHVHDRKFLPLLVSYNNQRVKTLAEVLRERVVASADSKAAHAALRRHRAEQSEVAAEFLEIGTTKVRSKISRNKEPMLRACVKVVKNRQAYWPISDREVHYNLLNDPPLRNARRPDSTYTNDKASYKDATDILTRGRLQGEISFTAIGDPTRKVVTWSVDQTPQTFIDREMSNFLAGYARDLMQSQTNHFEIVGEKNTVESSIRRVSAKYRIPYTLGRGYCSIDPVYRMVQRFKASGKEKLVVLVMSDFDPEGENIPIAFAKQLRDDFGVHSVEALKVGLTLEQVRKWDLPPNNMLEEKKEGSRYKAFVEKYGEGQSAHELEALEPEERARLLEDAILKVIDVDAYNHELDQEEQDAAWLEEVKGRLTDTMADVLDEMEEEADEEFPD
jgi:hypothetical protein